MRQEIQNLPLTTQLITAAKIILNNIDWHEFWIEPFSNFFLKPQF